VDHGTLIINDARVTIIDDLGLKQEISGSYLLTYSSKVSLNGTWYINQLGTSRKKPAVSAVTLVNITAHQNRLSLPFLHELSLRNLHHIGTLRENVLWVSSSATPSLYLPPSYCAPPFGSDTTFSGSEGKATRKPMAT